MKGFNRKTLSLSIVLAGIVWLIAIFVFVDISGSRLEYRGSVIGGLFAILMSLIYLQFFRTSPGRQATEVGAVPIYYTLLYLAVAFLLNMGLIFAKLGGLNSILLMLNAAITAVYVMLLLYSEKDSHRVAAQIAKTEQKLASTGIIAKKLGTLLGATENSEIKKQLLKLKESVDYSSNISTSTTCDAEQSMIMLLDEILQLTMENADPAVIKDKIHQAEIIWKTRSSAAVSVR